MKIWDVEVKVWLKPSVFDPQGNAVEQALAALGHEGVSDVRVGKNLSLTVQAEDEAAARAKVDLICQTVLCNLVIETYSFTIQERAAEAAV